MKTLIATTALRHRLPLCVALSSRPYDVEQRITDEEIEDAEKELHYVLEYESDRAYAVATVGG
jgi:hypothetical protein